MSITKRGILKIDKILKEIEEGKFDTLPKFKRKQRFIPYPRDLVKISEKQKQQ